MKPIQFCTPLVTYNCVTATCSDGRQECLSDGRTYSKCLCDVGGGQSGAGALGDGGVLPGSADAGGSTDASTDASAVQDKADAATPKEICGNGKDDDGDGNTDCADSDCDTLTCVPLAPTGFAGPVALYEGSAAPPDCKAEFAAKAFAAGANPDGADATCSTCECTPQSSACASFLNFTTSATSGCGGTVCTTSVNGSCLEISPPCVAGLSTASLGTALPAAAGSCTPSSQSPSKSAAAFGTHVVACTLAAPQRGGCHKDELCTPPAPKSFADTLCVWKAGSASCPAAYSDKHVYYRKLVDTRTCSACSCGGPDCAYSWQVFADSDTSCAAPIVTLTREDQCVQVNPTGGKLRVAAAISGTGACAPSGGTVTGAVSGGDPVTVCCLP